MNVHQNARLTPRGRAEIVRRVLHAKQSARQVARAAAVCDRTIRKWVQRFQAEDLAGLTDRSSRPQRSPRATPAPVALRIKVLRHQHRWTCAAIAETVGVSRATVARIVGRCGWAHLRALDPPAMGPRYERAHPGELLHLDTKKLGRIVRPGHRISGNPRDTVKGAGWEFAHMCVDDASRWARSDVLPDERGGTAAGFLRRTVRALRALGIPVRAVMTDNGSGYRSKRFAATCRALGIRQLFTRPYTPRTNGKVERFIQTSLRKWAYARVYASSAERRAALPQWLHFYNWHHRHSSLGGNPPITRVLSADNLVRLHS
jgi:transposase InsO family protein